MQCSGMQGLCPQLTGGVHFPSLSIYMQCSGMQGLSA